MGYVRRRQGNQDSKWVRSMISWKWVQEGVSLRKYLVGILSFLFFFPLFSSFWE